MELTPRVSPHCVLAASVTSFFRFVDFSIDENEIVELWRMVCVKISDPDHFEGTGLPILAVLAN